MPGAFKRVQAGVGTMTGDGVGLLVAGGNPAAAGGGGGRGVEM
jgi:hypothetical protein